MIITRTPYRISFFGGGTDYPSWYRKRSGKVLSTSINQYVYITCRYLPPFFEHRLRLAYSKVEEVRSASELTHPSAKKVFEYMGINDGVEVHYDGDLPSRSGIGSSSAFTVGLLKTLHAYKGEMVSNERLAGEAIFVEQEMVREAVGSQDQVSAAFGGLNKIEFPVSGPPVVSPIIMNPSRREQLDANLMFFFSGVVRTASDIASTYRGGTTQRESLEKSMNLVDQATDLLAGEDSLDRFGELLHQGWTEKKKLSPDISSAHIDYLYKRARASGAIGGKIVGAGGGGMLLLYVPADNQPSVKVALAELLHIPFRFETGGCQVVFFSDPPSTPSLQHERGK